MMGPPYLRRFVVEIMDSGVRSRKTGMRNREDVGSGVGRTVS